MEIVSWLIFWLYTGSILLDKRLYRFLRHPDIKDLLLLTLLPVTLPLYGLQRLREWWQRLDSWSKVWQSTQSLIAWNGKGATGNAESYPAAAIRSVPLGKSAENGTAVPKAAPIAAGGKAQLLQRI
jgi:hypothetical protein